MNFPRIIKKVRQQSGKKERSLTDVFVAQENTVVTLRERVFRIEIRKKKRPRYGAVALLLL